MTSSQVCRRNECSTSSWLLVMYSWSYLLQQVDVLCISRLTKFGVNAPVLFVSSPNFVVIVQSIRIPQNMIS